MSDTGRITGKFRTSKPPYIQPDRHGLHVRPAAGGATAGEIVGHDEECATALPRVAFDLGVSSQSHFARLFSDLTGMTPSKYRKQYKRTVG